MAGTSGGPRTPAAEPFRYDVDLVDAPRHLVRVALRVPAEVAAGARIVLPVWTPGSYVVRDFVHHVQWVRACTDDGTPVPVEHAGLSAWRLPEGLDVPVTFEMELHADALSVRTNHVDDHHALLHGAATFPYLEGHTTRPVEVRFRGVAAHHRVHGLLPEDAEGVHRARDHDELADAAFEVGDHAVHEVSVRGVPHRIVWAGHGPAPDLVRIGADLAAVADAGADVFGDIPCDRWTLLLESWGDGGGGLEHRDGAVIEVHLHALADPDRHARLQSLLAHEHFHLWNVERLAPRGLVRPDLERPVPSPLLWLAEGWTAYYDLLLPTRAGLWPHARLLGRLTDALDVLAGLPGVRVQSLRDASLSAWTKHYVRDANSPNAGTDYYVHGSLVALELDLALRAEPRPDGSGREGLDAVLHLLWSRHAVGPARDGVGYDEADVTRAVTDVGGEDIAARLVARTTHPGPPVLDDVLGAVGLRSVVRDATAPVELGVVLAGGAGASTSPTVRHALRDGPAWRAGIVGGDELLAVDGMALRGDRLGAALATRTPGEVVTFEVRRGPRMIRVPVTLTDPTPRLRLESDPDAGPDREAARVRWAGPDRS